MRSHGGIAALVILALVFTSAIADDGDAITLLRKRDFAGIETLLAGVQNRFENGALSEIELRNAYRPFYTLDVQGVTNLTEWVNRAPTSYPAHLAMGIYLKRKGIDARGTAYISDTPQQNIDLMRQYHAQAKIQLEKSLSLTKAPYLSVWHLLDMAIFSGDRDISRELLSVANGLLPNNRLARNRYMVSLEPRWGGSYAEMEDFVRTCRREGVEEDGIAQLEAIMHTDIGSSLEEQGNIREARNHFIMAIELAKKIGGDFRKDWIPATNYRCTKPEFAAYCQ